ncbi:hypothetical protein OEA41_000106 [Lepraria neglecta]|uniref:Uncharacterized protein n=1 Tax=Lepraria neglecta TaxID=209136 RepID=A0AAD9ZF53_9LECA|nr:hypothetical protein OEA41_000106 [Lepraria neglecta]
MAPTKSTKSAATELKKRKQALNVDDLKKLLDTEPDDYKIAWNELKHRIIELNEHTQQTVPSLAPSTLSLPDARQIFNLRKVKDILWAGINELPVPQYLSDNIDRILAVTSETHQTNEAFARTIIDQILISAIFEENNTQTTQLRASSQPEDPAVLELHHETQFQRQVTYGGETRLLSGYADYTVWYESQTRSNLATNLIIIEAKKINSTDTCLGQLTAYMGVVHAYRKDKQKQNSVVYGAASDGLSFRFCRIDNEGNWSQSRLLEWKMGDKGRIYSVFRSLVRIAALSSPSTSPIKNPQQREKVLASFGSPERTRKFDYGLSAMEILEEDDDTEIINWREPSS